MDVGLAIRKLRQEHGMTQAQFGEACFMSTNAVSALERGKSFPPRSTVERICRTLNVPVAYFLMASIEEDDFPENKRILYRTQLDPLRRELLSELDRERE